MNNIFKLSDDGKIFIKVLDKTAKHITIPYGVEVIEEGAFRQCSSLQSVNIPNSVTTIREGAFESCEALQSIDIPDSVTTIARGAFMDCSSLQSIDIPASVVDIGWYEFAHCTKLQSINVAEGNQHYTSIDGVLYNKMLTTLIRVPQGAEFEEFSIPDSVTTIEGMAFSDCSTLQSVYIPEGVTTIEMEAFEGCSSLQSIDIPASVEHIGTAAFSSCDALQSVHMHSTDVEERYSTYGVFDNEETGELTLYVSAGTIDAYRDRPMFSWFCNIEEE